MGNRKLDIKKKINSKPAGLPVVDEAIIQHCGSLPIDFWDFIKYRKEYTHNIHNYPAMMIPPISRELISIIKKHQPAVKSLMDPFAGSGTVMLEGIIAGLNVWGVDLNPLACLIAKAKCTPLDPALLSKAQETLVSESLSNISKLEKGKIKINLPKFKNIDFWFKPYVISHLQIIKQGIKKIKNQDIRTLFWVAFSETVRECSNTRNNEFKLYRIAEAKLTMFKPSVVDCFKMKIEKCILGMQELYGHSKKVGKAEIIAMDTRDLKLGREMDLMITSPPYGDSRTTVAYGQFSRLSLQWLDLEDYQYIATEINKSNLDKYLLGGNLGLRENKLPSDRLKDSLNKIAKVDKKRASEVLSFYIDLDQCLKSISSTMKTNSYQCWVVGNRTVKNINIPTNAIISDLGIQYDLKTVATLPRKITSKRMPKENSPSNIRGKKVTTMNNENIVILRKVK